MQAHHANVTNTFGIPFFLNDLCNTLLGTLTKTLSQSKKHIQLFSFGMIPCCSLLKINTASIGILSAIDPYCISLTIILQKIF